MSSKRTLYNGFLLTTRSEMLTRDLKKSNDNLIVHGKLIVNLSTSLGPLPNPPSAPNHPGSSLSVGGESVSSATSGLPPRSPMTSGLPAADVPTDQPPPHTPAISHPQSASVSGPSGLTTFGFGKMQCSVMLCCRRLILATLHQAEGF